MGDTSDLNQKNLIVINQTRFNLKRKIIVLKFEMTSFSVLYTFKSWYLISTVSIRFTVKFPIK